MFCSQSKDGKSNYIFANITEKNKKMCRSEILTNFHSMRFPTFKCQKRLTVRKCFSNQLMPFWIWICLSLFWWQFSNDIKVYTEKYLLQCNLGFKHWRNNCKNNHILSKECIITKFNTRPASYWLFKRVIRYF